MLPLEGIRVVDFSGHASGPMCGMILADFGAEVIKIESLVGDKARKWGVARFGANNEFSAEYLALNRNKHSIAVDLKHPDGAALARTLVSKSDVVLENFKPGVMKRLGLDYEALSALRPEIVYCSLSAFGQTGPLAKRPGFDLLMQAYAGPLSITGEKGRPAVRIGPTAIDFTTGLNGVIGILLALRERDRSGKGQHIDASLYESAIVLMTHMFADYTGSGTLPGRWGPHFAFLAPYGMFMAKDREFYLGASTDAMWIRLCEAMGRKDLLEDPRFKSNADRSKNQTALYEILIPLFRERTAAEWIAIAEANAIPNCLIHDFSEVVQQEQAKARDAFVPVEGIPNMVSAGIPIKLSRTPGKIRKAAPSLGADTDAVLERFGVTPEECKRLREVKAVK